jgi:hypothetical protein
VRVGSILTIAGECQPLKELSNPARDRQLSRQGLHGSSYVLLDVLGESLLDRTVRQIRSLTSIAPHIIAEGPHSVQVLPIRGGRPSTYFSLWDDAVSQIVREGADLILLVRMSTYSDVDYGKLIGFHREKNSVLTQVCAEDGSLDIALVSTSAFKDGESGYRRQLSGLMSRKQRFLYEGYVNRLRSPQDIHNLVQDALYGRCALKPNGTERADGVWVSGDAQVDSTAEIVGPVFIGDGAKVAGSCVVVGASSIERSCQIDCGTTISQSCVLQNTYVGVALDVRRSIVSNDRLFHLDRNVEIRIADRRLIGSRSKPMPFFSTVGSMLFGEARSGD